MHKHAEHVRHEKTLENIQKYAEKCKIMQRHAKLYEYVEEHSNTRNDMNTAGSENLYTSKMKGKGKQEKYSNKRPMHGCRPSNTAYIPRLEKL